MAAGDFSAGALCAINVMVEEAFTNENYPLARETKGFAPKVAALIKADSDANTDLENDGKFFKGWGPDKSIPSVTLRFLKTNAVLNDNCTDACTLDGTQAEASSVTLNLNICNTTGIKILESSLKSSSYTKEEVAAKELIARLKLLDQYWNKQALLFLKANQGAVATNGLLTNWTWDGTNKLFSVAAANYTTNLAAEIALMQELNNIGQGYVVDSGFLMLPVMNAQIDGGNCCGTGNAMRADMLDIVADPKGFAAAALTETSYHISSGSIAFVGYNEFTSTPEVIDASNLRETRYSIASPTIPNLFYDVRYQFNCTGARDFSHVWEIRTRGGLMLAPTGTLNPQGGAVKDTGIVALKRV